MRAYVDESARVSDQGWYVLASVAVADERAEAVRTALRQGLRNRRQRFHWRDAQDDDRRAMAMRFRELELTAVVVIATPMDQSRQERARRLCLTRLIWELEQRSIADFVFESRQGHRDAQDRAHILRAQRAKQVAPCLTYAFKAPLQEPLLWLPDLIAGAVSAAQAGVDDRCMQLLEPAVAVIEVGPAT